MTADSDQRVETWKPIPGFAKYEAGDLGHVRQQISGNVLATRVSNSGYLLVKPYDDNGKQQTRTVHTLVLLTFAGPCPAGQETLHGEGGPLDNRWPENIRYGTKQENAADQKRAGTAKTPAAYPCINHDRCGGMVAHPGRRCLPCVTVVGEQAAAMLTDGMSLRAVTRRLGYKKEEWVYKLAARYGGYSQPIVYARVNRQTGRRRAATTLRHWLRIGAK